MSSVFVCNTQDSGSEDATLSWCGIQLSYGGGTAGESFAGPSIRLHLVKPRLDLALTHLPDGRDDGELLGPWARRAGLPVVDGLGGDAHERAHLRSGQAEPRSLRAHTLWLEPQFRSGFPLDGRRGILRHHSFEAGYLLFQGLDAPFQSGDISTVAARCLLEVFGFAAKLSADDTGDFFPEHGCDVRQLGFLIVYWQGQMVQGSASFNRPDRRLRVG